MPGQPVIIRSAMNTFRCNRDIGLLGRGGGAISLDGKDTDIKLNTL